MADAKDLLISVAGAIADGVPVDWSRAESTAMSHEERSVLSELRVLEQLQHASREAAASSSDEETSSRASASTEPSVGTSHRPDDTSADTVAVTEPARWGPLEIRGVLGVGGFGIVYRAWDSNLESEV